MREVWILLLEKFTKLIEQASTLEEKQSLVVKRINTTALERIPPGTDLEIELQRLLDHNQLEPDLRRSIDITTPMALAVCLADLPKVRLFLNYIENINDPSHFVHGYRQLHSYVHLVASPYTHIQALSFRDQSIVEILNPRYEILKELVLKGADFNWRPSNDRYGYRNPPLAACYNLGGNCEGFMRDEMDKYGEIYHKLAKFFVTCGANPAIIGTSHMPSLTYMKPLIKHAAKKFIDNKFKFDAAPLDLRLNPEVTACFVEVINEYMTFPRTQFKTLLMCYKRQQQVYGNDSSLPGDVAKKSFDTTIGSYMYLHKKEIVNHPKITENINTLLKKKYKPLT